MDALSDVLRAVRLTGAVFFDVYASEPWVAEAPPGRAIVGQIFPGAEHLIPYHVVVSGTCWGHVVGDAPRQLVTGDVIVFPHGDPHVMSSAPGMRGTPRIELYRPPSDGHLPFTLTMGSERPEPTRIVCGFLGCDARPFNPLLSALPHVLVVNERAGGTLNELVRLAIAESKQPRMGGQCVLGHLSEVMFVDVVRRHLESLPSEQTDWLAALRDRFVGRALAALHASPTRDWTLEGLAREVGLSRSALAERFTAFVGQPPMQYLASWRMQLAATHLMNGIESVAEIADRVGYESEAAFSRAFKKAVGVSPGQWRKHRLARA
ncbi:MAG TPA: AraC family transcriptional regulator [Vicinamibacterales bacterium]|nr:AraC family transcriptional regulator [Vicinamibacterales bacterium]